MYTALVPALLGGISERRGLNINNKATIRLIFFQYIPVTTTYEFHIVVYKVKTINTKNTFKFFFL